MGQKKVSHIILDYKIDLWSCTYSIMDSGLFVKIFPTIINLKSGLNYNFSGLFTQIIPSIAETSPYLLGAAAYFGTLFQLFLIPSLVYT